MKRMKDILGRIEAERNRQDGMWGKQDHDDGKWMIILMEEIGEAAKDIYEGRPVEADTELIQCAAVLVAWIESRNRQRVQSTHWDGCHTVHEGCRSMCQGCDTDDYDIHTCGKRSPKGRH